MMSAYNPIFVTPRNTQSVGNSGGSRDLDKILNLNSVSPSPATRQPKVTQQSPSDTNSNNGSDSIVETTSEHSDPTTNQEGGESNVSQVHFSADGNNGNGYHHHRYGSSGGYNNNLYFNHHHSPYHRPPHIPSSTNLGYSPMSQASRNYNRMPSRNYNNLMYSCKIFIGGVPWEVSEGALLSGFTEFGTCQVEWPGKEPRYNCSPIKSTPRGGENGYVYIIYEQEESVRALLEKCSQDYGCGGDRYYKLNAKRSQTKEIRQVQVIPWVIGDSNYVLSATARLNPRKTVFIGALHGMVTAEILPKIMNDLFDSVVYAGVDTDKFKYPIGSGRVTFSTSESYYAAINSAFVEIKTTKFKKKVQIDPFLEDEICSVCNKVPGPFFCRQMVCFKYFCRVCWQNTHCNLDVFRHHKPLTRNSRRNIDNSKDEDEGQDRQDNTDHVGGSPGSRAGHGRSLHARRRLINDPPSPNVPKGCNGSNGDDGGPEGDLETVESYSSRPQLQHVWSLARIRCSSGENEPQTFRLAGQKCFILLGGATARFSGVEKSFSVLKNNLSIPRDL